MNAVATNSTPVTLQEGYYQGGKISGPNTPMSNIEYIHHVHDLSTNTKTISNDSPSVSSVSVTYPDSYGASSSGGCFTSGRYTSHTHTSSCKTHKHTGDSKKGGGCYTKKTVKEVTHARVEVGGAAYDKGDYATCPKCGRSVPTDQGDGQTHYDSQGHAFTVWKGYCTGRKTTVYETECGYEEGSYECRNSPYNTGYKYFRTCGKSSGQVIKAIITY